MPEKGKRVLALFLAAAILLQTGGTPVKARTDQTREEYEDIVGTYSVDDTIPGYREYIARYEEKKPEASYILEADSYVRYTEGDGGDTVPQIYTDYEGRPGNSVLTGEDALIEYEVKIEEEGFYDISLNYYPVEGKNAEIQRSFFLDGTLPYEEMAVIEFHRIWENSIQETEVNEDGIEIKVWECDNQGNDLKPSMMEAPDWIHSYLYDSNGYVTEALSVWLTKGVHTITMVSLREPMLLASIALDNAGRIRGYEEAKSAWDAAGAKDTQGGYVRIEAENAARTSSQMLYPQQDKSSPAVYPSSSKVLKNNSIGGNSWRLVGQWLEWDFEVKESGYYQIGMYDKQNFVKGIYVSRKIMIDGEVPFEEFADYGFRYKQNWRKEILSDEEGNAYKIYLEAGEHTLRMQAVLGEFSTIVSDVQDVVSQLNAIYRKVIRITGVAPDTYRDYQIETSLPELEEELTAVKDQLQAVIGNLREKAGSGSDKETVLVTMKDQLDELIKDQERFTRVIGSFKVNVRACGNWISQVTDQPLQIDSIFIYSPDVTVKVQKDSWFAKLWFEIRKLFYSFFVDYNQIGNVSEEKKHTITVWVGTGRDQANVIKSMIDESFTKEFGTSVNVMLVDMNTLLQATLAGEGPDVAIQVNMNLSGNQAASSNDMPMNYGLRHAVADLSRFEDLREIRNRFHESAMVAYEFEGAIYALPETQTFPMMFYRKDILKELGMELPRTWDEMKVAMTVLAKNQMEIGMLPSESVFAMFLYQNGGEYYTQDGKASALDTEEGINAFKEYCEYYTDYKLDKETSVEERFRTGEAPIIIADYTLYNNLQVSAPDIKGLWGFAPVPGTVREDGSVDNTVGSSGQASVIMEASEYKEESWEFLKWWTSADIQTQFGREMESLMGAAARVATANTEAFANLPWPAADYDALQEQFQTVKGIPQVPGGYFSWRNVNNAFYTVTTDTDTASPREELMDKVILINDEINYKRKEFGLPTADESSGGTGT